jgi:hypothetical protein
MVISSESYLHKYAKELLYLQIKKNKSFSWKTNEDAGDEDITYGDICMECPVQFDALKSICIGDCKIATLNNIENYSIIAYLPTRKDGYSYCTSCKHLIFTNCIVHDIILEWKSNISCAIEIINKHSPQWRQKIKLSYPVYLIDASNILKRVSDTPAFVSEIIK